ncbi:MAG: aerobic-type carbon monoxide dehydrogenase, large subunit CoxL/CutL-like protein, partial [Gemmatimonadetes bacterium]|nr:aerobic-type carbon monoxide dehydrogenase, large subunit CoxL/CutL-like protein [Gemmatimonadota bacterium]
SRETLQVGDDNLLHRTECVSGEPDTVLAGAARVVEGCYETGSQEHLYLEPQAMLASLEHGMVTVRGSMQCPFYVQEALTRVLGPAAALRVVPTPVGGGFGGKEDYPSMIAAHAAMLALMAGHPVKLVYDRGEDMACTPKRHPALVRHRTAVAPDGELLAMEIDVLLDGGAYATLSPIILNRATIHAAGPYRCPHVRIRGRVRLTNRVPNGAFRGFGNPQVAFAVERHLDRIAEALGLEPAAVRRRNLLRDGEATPTGQRIADGVDAPALLDHALALADHERRRPAHAEFNRTNRWLRRGTGLATSFHGAGLPGAVEAALGSRLELEALQDGRVRLLSSIVEMGQGVETVFADLVGRRLGLEPAEIEIAVGDTSQVPNSGPSVASRTSMVVGRLVEQACDDLRARLALAETARGDAVRQAIRERLAAQPAIRLVGRAGYVPAAPVRWDPDRFAGDAYPAYGWAAQVAEVEVDLRTGMTRVMDLVSVQDVGTILQPLLARGQVQGGVAQAVGWALSERVASDRGAMLNATLRDYVIPTAADLPPIRVAFVETPSPHGARGARGLGELPMVGAAAAVVNAISQAIGRPLDRLPAMPEDVLAAIAVPVDPVPEPPPLETAP